MSKAVFERIRRDITENDVVLYMKGSTSFPQCGFSAAVVDILQQLHVAFKDIDVLMDVELHQGVKDFSNWPAIPQLYIKGEFIGGCDIVREMHGSGELKELLSKKEIQYKF